MNHFVVQSRVSSAATFAQAAQIHSQSSTRSYSRMKKDSQYIIGVDIGGTFTDCVVLDEDGNRTVGKALSTPDDFSMGVIDAIRDAAKNLGLGSENELVQSTKIFFHACTVGDNALITRTGAKTGLITTKGFADTMLMMRGKMWQGLSEIELAHLSANRKPDPWCRGP